MPRASPGGFGGASAQGSRSAIPIWRGRPLAVGHERASSPSGARATCYRRRVKVIDAHAHLEARILDVPVMLRKLDAAGIDQVVLIPTMNDVLPETPRGLLAFVRQLIDSPLHDVARRINDALMTPDGHLKLRGQIVHIY